MTNKLFGLKVTHEQQSNMGNSIADVVFIGDKPTLKQFIDYVVESSKDEYGEIAIVKDKSRILNDYGKAKYGYGKLNRIDQGMQQKANCKIKEATCWFSWCVYDYYVVLEESHCCTSCEHRERCEQDGRLIHYNEVNDIVKDQHAMLAVGRLCPLDYGGSDGAFDFERDMYAKIMQSKPLLDKAFDAIVELMQAVGGER